MCELISVQKSNHFPTIKNGCKKYDETEKASDKWVYLSLLKTTDKCSNITNGIMHYRNVYAGPNNYIARKIEYKNMKVYDNDYRYEVNRLNSLGPYFNDSSFKEKLARAGFYKNPDDKTKNKPQDKVKCIYCQGSLSKWVCNNDPMKEHSKFFPTCPFLLKLDVGNKPIIIKSDKKISYDFSDCKANTNNDTIAIIVNTKSFDSKYETLDMMLLDRINIDWRRKTFESNDLSNIIHLALYGIYIIVKQIDGRKSKLAFCYHCEKQTKVLVGAEKLPLSFFHHNSCSNFKEMDTLIKNQSLSGTKKHKLENNNSCEIEYAISKEEISIRMDSKRVHDLIKNFHFKRELIEEVIESKLKSTCQDYGSIFQLFKDVQNFERPQSRNIQKYNIMEYVIKDPCVVCLDAPVEVISLPCGHLKTCYECSERLQNCAVCRETIVRKVSGVKIGV